MLVVCIVSDVLYLFKLWIVNRNPENDQCTVTWNLFNFKTAVSVVSRVPTVIKKLEISGKLITHVMEMYTILKSHRNVCDVNICVVPLRLP